MRYCRLYIILQDAFRQLIQHDEVREEWVI